MDNSEAFAILRPVCVKLTNEINKENVNILRNTLSLVNRNCLQDFQEYILFPLQLILKSTSKKDDFIQCVVATITELLNQTSITKFELLENISTVIIILISHPKNNGQISNVSEELKTEVVKCQLTIFKNSTNEVLKRFFSQSLAQLGHLVFVFLRLAENETNKQLRIKSIECLHHLSCCTDKKDYLKTIASQAFASFLPGISISLARIITGTITQGHGVTTVSLKAWADVLCLVLGDSNLELSKKHEKKFFSDEKFGKAKLSMITRDDEWVKGTSEKLSILIDKIIELVSHSDWRVRLALANWAGVLLINCNRSLFKCAGPLLEVLITLSGDERTNVSKRSGELLVQSGMKLQNMRPIVDLIEENIHNLITKLPRIFRMSDDAKKLSTLQLLIGYIRILVLVNENMDGLLLSHPQLIRLGQAMMQLAELDYSNVQSLVEKNCVNNLADFNTKPTKKIFKHFRDERVYSSLTLLCRLLGKYGDLHLLVDHCLDLFHNSNVYKCQSVLIIKELLLGAAGINLELENMEIFDSMFPKSFTYKILNNIDLIDIIKLLLDEYLEPSVWYCDVSKTNSLMVVKVEQKTHQQIHNNVWLICLILESIASFSQILKNEFELLLMIVLYPVLEKMGNDLSVISHSSSYCASMISLSVGCNSIADLIYKNSDYLLNSLTMKLQHIERYPEAITVLQVIFLNSGPDILGLLENSIEQLLNGLDNFYHQTSEPFIQVLNTLMTSFLVWFSEEKQNENSSQNKQLEDKCLFDYFTEYHQLKLTSRGETMDFNSLDKHEELQKQEEEEDDDDETKKPKPNFVKFTIETMQRCSHLLSRKHFNFTLLVLDTIKKCILVLKDWTDDLLPLVHQIWPSFKWKFCDKNLIIVKKTCDVLNTMAEVCSDFIKKRTLDHVWPKLLQFLDSQAKISEGKLSSAYTFTVAYKLQLEIFSTCGKLILKMKVGGADIDSFIEVCLLYLNNQQPKVLQEAALEAIRLSANIEPDIVWLHLCYLDLSLIDLNPPDSEFSAISKSNNVSTLYEEDLKLIFEEIYVKPCTESFIS